jgi:putative membrane protein
MAWHEVLPAVSTSLIVISAVLVAIGWRLILRKRRKAHENVMLAAAVAALLFFVLYLSRTIFVGNTSWGGPPELKSLYLIFLLFHIVLATVAAVFGATTLVLAWRKRFAQHRRWGRTTSVIWFATALTGVTVYVLLYVMYPGGHTAPLFDAIFG